MSIGKEFVDFEHEATYLEQDYNDSEVTCVEDTFIMYLLSGLKVRCHWNIEVVEDEDES